MLAKLLSRFSGVAETPEADDDQAGRDTIVLVDDDADLREFLRLALRHRGYRVLDAGNGKEGVDLITRERPAAAVLDGNMPIMDGFEVLRRLRRQRATAEVPVIMLTSRNRQGDVLTGYKYGAQEYLTKPVNVEEVLNALKLLVKKQP